MRVVHRIGLRANSAQRRQLEELAVRLPKGITLPGGGDPLLAFDVDEGHPNWEALSSLFQAWHVSDVTRTEFSNKEVDAAPWLEISAWHHGYPQPEEDFGYREVTYDLSDWCETCGIGMKQRAPFRMKAEPKWGRNAMLQLIWVYGELFVTPDAWRQIFKPNQVGFRTVLNSRGAELKTVMQLVVEPTVNIITDGLASERCRVCNRTKYQPVTRGPFPPLRQLPVSAMVRTAEYFGSGGQADQRLLLSRPLVQALTEHGLRGASLRPVGKPG